MVSTWLGKPVCASHRLSQKFHQSCTSHQSIYSIIPLLQACPGQGIHMSVLRLSSNTATCQPGLPYPLFTFCCELWCMDHKTRLYKYAPMHSCKMLLCTDLCQYICVYWCSLFFLDYIQQIIDLHAGYHYQGLKQCHIKLPTDRVHLNPAFLSNVLQFHRQWLFRRVPVKSQDFWLL